MINIDGYKIVADPVFEKSVSFFGPTRYNGEVPVDVEQLPEAGVFFLSGIPPSPAGGIVLTQSP